MVYVVALAGHGMVGRLSASLLIHGGKSDWVARDLHGYVSIASAFANEGPRNKSKRMELRHEVQGSALADGSRLSQELERHYFELRQKISSC